MARIGLWCGLISQIMQAVRSYYQLREYKKEYSCSGRAVTEDGAAEAGRGGAQVEGEGPVAGHCGICLFLFVFLYLHRRHTAAYIFAKVFFRQVLCGKFAVSTTEGLRDCFPLVLWSCCTRVFGCVLHIKPSVEYIVVYFCQGPAKPPTR